MRAELELLAPARDAEIGIEAINHGADAVYIGGPAFGARDKAGNSLADIARLVTHAHRFGARIFITLNTILRDDELDEARRMAWQVYEAGADALIVQDMGLLEIDLPPIQLHASTQTDIRTPEKARFLQDVGFSQMVLARELTLEQISAVSAAVDTATIEFFIHGALCVAYSGQCFISHAITGRSANRGSCSQECRQPYTVLDKHGRIVAHDKHVLSLKDNDQSANLAALVDAGVRSFKIEGRYKDMGYVKNVTAHYRRLFDAVLEGKPHLKASSSGRTTFLFTPDPARNFNRDATDYFVNGRKMDIGAFDTPKHAGTAFGHVLRVADGQVDLRPDDPSAVVHNGDGITWWDLQGELQGFRVSTAAPVSPGVWRIAPNDLAAPLKDLKRDVTVHRNRDMAWDRTLEKKSADRRIGVQLLLSDTDHGLALSAIDADGHGVTVEATLEKQPARDAAQAEVALSSHLGKLGNTIFEATDITLATAQPWFVPTGAINALRRDAIAALEAERARALPRLARAVPVDPPVHYPEDTLTYLANVYNHQARNFYARHGVKVIASAYESHEELGQVPLMITKHCVRWSLSLCPKQAKGVTGVQGTVRAEPMTLKHDDLTYTLVFDCKPCEMHVVGQMQKHVLKQAPAAPAEAPIHFYRARLAVAAPRA